MKKNWAPSRKITGGTTVGGSIAFIIVWLLQLNGVEVPTGLESAIGAVVVGLIAYLIPDPEV